MSTSTQMLLLDDAVSVHENGMTVLVVDDYPCIGELISLGLNGLGCHTDTASNGEEAREIIMTCGVENIDLLIVELEIPGEGGQALAEWFLRKNLRGQAILMSAYPFDTPSARRMAFLQKPFRHEELLAKVNQALVASRRNETLSYS